MTEAPSHLVRHLVDDVLPWWVTHGPDERHGGVLTCWNNAGTELVSTDKYTWSQGRWAWLTSRVALAGRDGLLNVDSERFADLAVTTAKFVRDHMMLPDGTTAFVTDQQGRPHEPAPGSGLHTSIFADLFAALGFAGAHRIQPGAGWAQLADDLLAASAERGASGQYRSDPYPVPNGYRALSLPMILVGVGEQVYRASNSARAARIVAGAAQDIARHHVVGDDVVEMPRWSPSEVNHGLSLLERHRTPGHVLECVWFLHHARDLIEGDVFSPERLGAIACHALQLGWDDEHGGLFRYVDADGGAPRGHPSPSPYESTVTDTWDNKLWWPHAEAMYATRLLASRAGGEQIEPWRRRVESYTFHTFPEGPGREWSQIRNRNGHPLEKVVALPVKDPFHVARALLLSVELDAVAERN